MPIVSKPAPSSLPPSGTAGGDLGGTYPGPTVAKVNGVGVTGTAASGKVIQASSASAASWQTPSAATLAQTLVAGADPGGTALTGELDVHPTVAPGYSILDLKGPSGFEASGGAFQTITYSTGGNLALTVGGYGDPTHQISVSLQNSAGSGGLVSLDSGGGVGVLGDGMNLNVRKTNSTRVFQADETRGVLFAVHTVPADGDIEDGECSMWFDQTNGAGNTKVMFKGKSANGTVKTATILLA